MTEQPSGDDLRRVLANMWRSRRSEVASQVGSAADIARRIAHVESTDWASLRANIHQLVGVLGVYRLDDLRALVVSLDEAARVGDDPTEAGVIADQLDELRRAVERHSGPSTAGEDQ